MADLTSIGVAIGYSSSGLENAFDKTDENIFWNSGGIGLASGNWIGRNFGQTYTVQTVYYHQAGNDRHINAIKLQYSNDGVTWMDIQTVDLTSTDTVTVSVDYYPGGSCFRVAAAASSISPYSWMVGSIILTGVIGVVVNTSERRRCVI